MGPNTQGNRIFISHSSQDNEFTDAVAAQLKEAGYEVWLSQHGMTGGDLLKTLSDQLEHADQFIVVLSPAARESEWVHIESGLAWHMINESNHKLTTIVPALYRKYDQGRNPAPDIIPAYLSSYFYIDYTRQPFESATEELIRSLGGRRTRGKKLTDWREVHSIQASMSGIFALAWAPNGRLLATGSQDKTIKIWETEGWNLTHTLRGHTTGIDALAWAPNSQWLASGSFGSHIRLWNGISGDMLGILDAHTKSVTDLAWSSDGAHLVCCTSDDTSGTIQIWDIDTSHPRLIPPDKSRLVITNPAPLTSVSWSPNGRWLATGERGGLVRIWDATSIAELHTLQGHERISYCARWSPNGDTLASSGNTTVRLWDPTTWKERAVLKLSGNNVNIIKLAWRPDGEFIATGGGADHSVRAWSVAEKRKIADIGLHKDWVHGVAWSPSGDLLATGGGKDDGMLRIWEPTE